MEDLEARLYELYRASFEKAERERRWSVSDDVPWSLARRDVAPSVASSAETFFCTHIALPDFVAKSYEAVRTSSGPRWFLAAWAYEKSRHQLALRQWLETTGHRSRESLAALEASIQQRPCEVPFDTGRQLLFYGAVQEMATFVTYAKHREVARLAGDECLRTIYDFLARDEFAHARYFEANVRVLLEDDRAGTLADMAYVLERFVTPGELILEDYDQRMLAVREAGLDGGVFIQRVYMPLLKRLGVSRRDLSMSRPPPPITALSPMTP